METYNITTNIIELISGTNNTTSPLYVEAVKNLESNTSQMKGYLKNFLVSIEGISSGGRTSDPRISNTKGNIQEFSGYQHIKTAINYLSKNSNDELTKDLHYIFRALEVNKIHYVDGYNKQIRLIILEYETAVYMLITGLVLNLVTKIDVEQSGLTMKVVNKKNNVDSGGVIIKIINELAKQLNLKDHSNYLRELIKAKNNVPIREATIITEATIADTVELIDSLVAGASKIGSFGWRVFLLLKNTLFGILPLIRSGLYVFKYKRKADMILALEEQIHFISMNIDQLNNIKTMDDIKKAEIISKQQAVIEAYRKKSEKLRAELIETEKDASVALQQNDPDMQQDSSDEFIL